MDESLHATVHFSVQDVTHPGPAQILCELFAHHHLQGEVIASTSDGLTPHVVVKVSGLTDPVIVPAVCTQATSAAAKMPLESAVWEKSVFGS